MSIWFRIHLVKKLTKAKGAKACCTNCTTHLAPFGIPPKTMKSLNQVYHGSLGNRILGIRGPS